MLYLSEQVVIHGSRLGFGAPIKLEEATTETYSLRQERRVGQYSGCSMCIYVYKYKCICLCIYIYIYICKTYTYMPTQIHVVVWRDGIPRIKA